MKFKKSIKYPVKLGVKGINTLKSDGGMVSKGRWINTNHEDWNNPKWVKTETLGTLVDRSIGGLGHSKEVSDIAIYTEYADPKLNMPMYDLVPVDSVVFDMDEEPKVDVSEAHDYLSINRKTGIKKTNPHSYPVCLLGTMLVFLLAVPRGENIED